MTRRLKRYWREILLVALMAAPWLALLVLGFLWLMQNDRVLVWALGAVACGLLAWPIRRAIRTRAGARLAAELDARAAPDPAWREIERKAWEDVEALAASTPPLEPDREAATELARRTVETVAKRFHPDDPDAAARVTLPELLLLTERVSRDLRRFVLSHLPGARTLRIDHALKVKRLVDRWGAPAQRAFEIGFAAWRVGRVAANPTTGVAQELARWLDAEGRAALAGNLRSAATRELVRETGRAAIDLYAGRLRLTAQEIETAEAAERVDAAPPAPMPVRVVLLGQVNAGKSSTANAMAGAVLAETGPTPTPGGAREWEIRAEGRPAVLLVDTAGLDGTDAARDAAIAEAARADAIVWVASATQPARAADADALQALRRAQSADLARRPPPLILALTGVDRLRPAAEWAPPYDPAGSRPKEGSLRAATDAVAAALDIPRDAIVPVAVPSGAPPWNHEALWAAIAARLDEAKLRRIEGLRARGGTLREMASQLGASAKLLGRLAFKR